MNEYTEVSRGSGTGTDTDLQAVPLDADTANTPQFPYNWQKAEGDAPFVLRLTCRALQMVLKDSGSPAFGAALVTVDGGEKGASIVTHRLYLHTKTEGLLCSFFESIGQRKHGEPLRPRWGDVTGSTGHCRLGIHEFTKKDGSAGRSNEIVRFLPPPEPKAAPASGGWVQGSF